MLEASLIDLDGFLINSEGLYLEANKIYFKRFGFDFTEALHRQATGKKFDQWITKIISLDKPGSEILKERNKVFFSLASKKLHLLDGARELLTFLHGNSKTALVTSSERDYVDFVFDKTGIEPFFDLVITGDMVVQGKPDPECYLTAAEKLKVTPQASLVFEDAPAGVLAGRNAGMKVIAVPSSYVLGDKVFKQANLVLNNLREITPKTINSVIP